MSITHKGESSNITPTLAKVTNAQFYWNPCSIRVPFYGLPFWSRFQWKPVTLYLDVSIRVQD